MRKKNAPLIVCFCLSLLIAVLRVGPPAWAPHTYIVGGWNHPDNLGNHWLLVWVAEQLSIDGNLLHNNHYYLPVGDYPWLAGNGTEGVLFWPLYNLFGWPAGAGILATVLLVGVGMSGYYLGRSAGVGPWGSLITAAGCASMPSLQRELSAGRFSQIDICWFLLSLGSFILLIRQPSRKQALICGVMVALCGVFYWYYAFFFVISASLLCVSAFIANQKLNWQYIALAAVVSFLLVSPVLGVYLSNWQLIPGTAEVDYPPIELRNDSIPLSFPFIHQFGIGAGATISIGLGIWIPFAFRKSSPSLWLSSAAMVGSILFYLLALGEHGFLFFWVYDSFDVLRRYWWPSRHLIVYSAFLSLLAGVGFSRLFVNSSRIQYKSLLAALAIPGFLYLQGDRPLHALYSQLDWPPESYTMLAKLPGQAIIQPPLSREVASSQAHLLFQLAHGKKLLTGHAQWVDRVRPEEWDQLMKKNRFISGLQAFESGEQIASLEFGKEDVDWLTSHDLQYIVLDKELFNRKLSRVVNGYSRIFTQLFGPPIRHLHGVKVWSLGKWNGTTKVKLPRFSWPAGLRKGNGKNCLKGLLFPSKVFVPPKHHRKNP